MLEGIGASTLVGMLLWAGWAVGSFVADYILSWHRDRYIKRICDRMAVVDLVYENAKRTEIAAEWIGCSTASLPDYAVAVKLAANHYENQGLVVDDLDRDRLRQDLRAWFDDMQERFLT